MCCSSGICGTNIDPDPANFAAMFAQLGKRGSQSLWQIELRLLNP